jgi:hypothetical protein
MSTAELVICQSCSVYIGAIEETAPCRQLDPGGNPPLIVAFPIFRGQHLCAAAGQTRSGKEA